MEKGQANVFWIIIGAVIALVVLAVLLLMFTGKTTVLEQGISGCEVAGGECKPSKEACKVLNGTVVSSFECGTGQLCCLGIEAN